VLARFSDEPVALLDLDLRHLAATERYAAQLGTTRAQVMGGPLAPMAMEADALRDALARVLFGEIDYCQVAITPLGDPASRTMVQAAMVREADATPRCVVVVTHELSTRHTA
jgi:PAS domain-containing protein